MEDFAREIKNLKLTVEGLRERIRLLESRVRGLPIRGQLGGYSVVRRIEVLAILDGNKQEKDTDE